MYRPTWGDSSPARNSDYLSNILPLSPEPPQEEPGPQSPRQLPGAVAHLLQQRLAQVQATAHGRQQDSTNRTAQVRMCAYPVAFRTFILPMPGLIAVIVLPSMADGRRQHSQ